MRSLPDDRIEGGYQSWRWCRGKRLVFAQEASRRDRPPSLGGVSLKVHTQTYGIRLHAYQPPVLLAGHDLDLLPVFSIRASARSRGLTKLDLGSEYVGCLDGPFVNQEIRESSSAIQLLVGEVGSDSGVLAVDIEPNTCAADACVTIELNEDSSDPGSLVGLLHRGVLDEVSIERFAHKVVDVPKRQHRSVTLRETRQLLIRQLPTVER